MASSDGAVASSGSVAAVAVARHIDWRLRQWLREKKLSVSDVSDALDAFSRFRVFSVVFGRFLSFSGVCWVFFELLGQNPS